MSDPFIEWICTASFHVKVAYLRGFFESSAAISEKLKIIMIKVQPSSLKHVIRLLQDVGASPQVIGTEPFIVAVSVEEAVRMGLFDPEIKGKKPKEANH
jgi:hypothetical protein